jgi:hypothetical protein
MSTPEKIYDEIVTRWNKQTDEFNQWDNLSIDEKVEFAYQCGTELAECKAALAKTEAELTNHKQAWKELKDYLTAIGRMMQALDRMELLEKYLLLSEKETKP